MGRSELDVDLRLEEGTTLTGVAAGGEGAPLAGARVVACPRDEALRWPAHRLTWRSGRVGAAGEFRLEHVPAGAVTVLFLDERSRATLAWRELGAREGESLDASTPDPSGTGEQEPRCEGTSWLEDSVVRVLKPLDPVPGPRPTIPPIGGWPTPEVGD